MGLFDQVTNMLNGGSGEAGKFTSILTWIQEQGGVQALLAKFQQQGLGDTVSSWLGSGSNQTINPQQVQETVGAPAINSLAEKLGVDPSSASNLLAEHFPKIVDTLSPNGQVNQNQDLLTQGLDMLKGKLFS